MFYAVKKDKLAGIQLWLTGDGAAYHHLSAYSDIGYQERASYGLMWQALNHFQSQRLEIACLGGSAGNASRKDGLYQFKKGWSTHSKTAYFCGRVINQAFYDALEGQLGGSDSRIFPAYRWKEFLGGES